MKLSIVTTMYYSSPYLEEFYKRITKQALIITHDYEIIFVNDGSPDDSLDIAITLHNQDEKVKVVDLSRNFGHHKAIMTGLKFAKGEQIFLIDCDLEEEPELLETFYRSYKEEPKCDVIYGVQRDRKGGFFERISGKIFYRLINFLSGMDMPRNVITARLMSRQYVGSLLEFSEQELFLAGLWFITGYKQVPVEVVKHFKGKSAYTFSKKLTVLVNSVTSFSSKPLEYIFSLGLIIISISLAYSLYLVFTKIFFDMAIAGWTSLIVSVWLLGGLIIFFMGIIGIYLSKIFIETKNRPYTIIRSVYGGNKNEK